MKTMIHQFRFNLLIPFLVLLFSEVSAQTDSLRYAQVTTTDHKRVVGKLISQDEQYVVVESMDGVRFEFRKYDVKEVLQISPDEIHRGKYWFPDVNRNRYTATSSAAPMKKGNGYVQLFGLRAYGTIALTDHLVFGIGSELYHPLNGDAPELLYCNLRYSGKLMDRLYTGIELIGSGEDIHFSNFSTTSNRMTMSGRGLLTFQNRRWSLTGSVGYGMVRRQYLAYDVINHTRYIDKENEWYNNVLYSLSARFRMTRRFSFVWENALIPRERIYYYYYLTQNSQSPEYLYMYHTTWGFNVSGRRFSAGTGIYLETLIDFPDLGGFFYLDLTYRFGKQ